MTDQQGDSVYVVGSDNKAVKTPVKLGQSTTTMAGVIAGLTEGKSVIVEGIQTGILQMEASAGPRLPPRPAFSKSAASPAASDAHDKALALRRERIRSEFSVIEAHLSRGF
jgi:membrane fusion protein, multidrug efflux system